MNPEQKSDQKSVMLGTSHDMFSDMIEGGHGVRVHRVERPMSDVTEFERRNPKRGESRWDVESCPNHMAVVDYGVKNMSQASNVLLDDGWAAEPAVQRLTEELHPADAGPWALREMEGETWCEETQDWVVLGYSASIDGNEDEEREGRWPSEFQTHRDGQSMLRKFEAKWDRELKAYCLESGKEVRNRRFNKICRWLAAMPTKRAAQLAQGPLYYKLGLSRKRAARSGKWWYVYLTKSQVNFVKSALQVLKSDGSDERMPEPPVMEHTVVLDFEAYVAAYKEPVSFADSLGNACHRDYVRCRYGSGSVRPSKLHVKAASKDNPHEDVHLSVRTVKVQNGIKRLSFLRRWEKEALAHEAERAWQRINK